MGSQLSAAEDALIDGVAEYWMKPCQSALPPVFAGICGVVPVMTCVAGVLLLVATTMWLTLQQGSMVAGRKAQQMEKDNEGWTLVEGDNAQLKAVKKGDGGEPVGWAAEEAKQAKSKSAKKKD